MKKFLVGKKYARGQKSGKRQQTSQVILMGVEMALPICIFTIYFSLQKL